eukprot:scaffold20660_cov129-Isochrysis_galbana.AAC.2
MQIRYKQNLEVEECGSWRLFTFRPSRGLLFPRTDGCPLAVGQLKCCAARGSAYPKVDPPIFRTRVPCSGCAPTSLDPG